MKKKTQYIIITLLLIIGLFFSIPAHAVKKMTETKLPDTLSTELNYLLNLAEPDRANAFDADRIGEILAFVSQPKTATSLYYADQAFGAPSAYYEFDMHVDMNQVLQLAHNPDLPSYLLMPSSVRLSYWTEIDGRRQPLPRLWQSLPRLDQTVMVRGVEHIENTPDLFSGGYYQYDLNRALILLKHNGRNVLISVSKQTKTSNVGRKGLVLGPDDAWNYLYSNQKGLAKTGLGWVSSYMYDSFAITVYDEIEPDKPLVRCGIFKWVRAGWAKFNVVNSKHIYQGLDRYAKTFKEIIEHPFLPNAADLTQLISHIENLSNQDLRAEVKKYFSILKEQYADDTRLSQHWITDILNSDRYVSQMSQEEMKSVLVVQFLKNILTNKLVVFKPRISP